MDDVHLGNDHVAYTGINNILYNDAIHLEPLSMKIWARLPYESNRLSKLIIGRSRDRGRECMSGRRMESG